MGTGGGVAGWEGGGPLSEDSFILQIAIEQTMFCPLELTF